MMRIQCIENKTPLPQKKKKIEYIYFYYDFYSSQMGNSHKIYTPPWIQICPIIAETAVNQIFMSTFVLASTLPTWCPSVGNVILLKTEFMARVPDVIYSDCVDDLFPTTIEEVNAKAPCLFWAKNIGNAQHCDVQFVLVDIATSAVIVCHDVVDVTGLDLPQAYDDMRSDLLKVNSVFDGLICFSTLFIMCIVLCHCSGVCTKAAWDLHTVRITSVQSSTCSQRPIYNVLFGITLHEC
jgi:hypothetical protein